MTASISLSFRRADVDDLKEIIELYLEDTLGQTRERLDSSSWERYEKAFKAIDQDPHQFLVVGTIQGILVSSCQLTLIPCLTHQGGLRLQIEGVHVKKGYQGQKIGRHMMEWVLSYGQSQEAFMAQLTTHKSRQDAQRFYRSLGFEETHIGMKKLL